MRLLDIFCGEGGAGLGYIQAGWTVVGVDLKRSAARRYPGDFVHADALDYLARHGHRFDAVHASPPCQAYSVATKGSGKENTHPRLIGPVRALLVELGKPYVIENVVGAPLRNPVLLCGSMFDLTATDTDGTPLRLERHRLFETNWDLQPPGACRHDPSVAVGGVYGGGSHDRARAKNVRRGGYTPAKTVRAELIGTRRLSMRGLNQSIPPEYTKWVGTQMLAHIQEA